MRWIKHLAVANHDPKISQLIDSDGPEGYGAYWLLLEEMAVVLEPKMTVARLTHSWLYWSQRLRVSVRKCRRLVKRMAELGLIDVQSTTELVQIDVPKLLKYRDEHSKRSGAKIRELELEGAQSQKRDSTGPPNRPARPEPERAARSIEPITETRTETRTATQAEIPAPTAPRRPVSPPLLFAPPLDPLFELWVDLRYTRHPKKVDQGQAKQALRDRFRGRPDLQQTFERSHERMVESADWRERNGRFAPRLHDWIADDAWLDAPPDESFDPGFVPRFLTREERLQQAARQ